MVNKPLPCEGSMCLTPQENAVAELPTVQFAALFRRIDITPLSRPLIHDAPQVSRTGVHFSVARYDILESASIKL
ncbi:hypothetical protein O77CONTIG1_03306 [Leptolyngbya sp. O-77]|nr:hypothetical protein O77CONTIG1_03306 [Leptolyngbya sp. O-77]